VTRPVMQLKGFQRVTLKPGEKKTVEFTITPDALSMLNVDMHSVIEPGIFEVMVGPSSDKTKTVTLAVTGPYGETGIAPPPPPPAGSESGVVSNFDDLKTSAHYGAWMAGSDGMNGGKSASSIKAVAGGANNSKGAMEVSGELVAGAPFLWGGALFSPAGAPGESVNLSGKKTISFWAKGDGKSYMIAVSTEANQGGMPSLKPFTAGPDWKQYSFSIDDFKTDGSDITGLAFVSGGMPGKFDFEIDEVEIK